MCSLFEMYLSLYAISYGRGHAVPTIKWFRIVSSIFLIHTADTPSSSNIYKSALENFVKTSNHILQSPCQLKLTVINVLYQFYWSSIWKDFDSLNASSYVRDDKIDTLQENSNPMIG